MLHDGEEEAFELDTYRMRIRALVREELDRVATGARSAIDLSKVAEAEAAAIRRSGPKRSSRSSGRGLRRWRSSSARPKGQMLGADARSLIAKGLGLLGSACVHLGEVEQAEEVFRIGIRVRAGRGRGGGACSVGSARHSS